MGGIHWKKMLYILIPAVIILGSACWAIWIPTSENDQKAVEQEASKVIRNQAMKEQENNNSVTDGQAVETAENSQADTEEGGVNTEGRELLGTIVEVYETEDPNFLLLTVEVDVVDENATEGQSDADEELPTTKKIYEVSVSKDVPVIGGTMDDLSEDDFVMIITNENVSDGNELSALSIEEL